ncbi:alkaline phosphatase [Citricoccus muralis]|uniref:Alkaline phosphatase n=1 Tax=Citricoccus muralis TaxID=169134 RepID=A0ABY8H4J8_9MICC|nr:alkaline phosphatase [Citricoccus muralis]WFP16071.1 alkaline phosphatase [Citricoccus muralis]
MMSKKTTTRAAAGVLATAVVAGASLAPAYADQADQNGSGDNGPKNVIVMIGDGMGYNHVVSTNLYETGQSQFITEGAPGAVTELDGDPVQSYESFNLLGMSTHSQSSIDAGYDYDSEDAWGSFGWANNTPTDSAAAGTAMATGTKTNNGMLNVDPEGNELTTVSEVAHETGRSAGVVSSVDFNHATPSAYAVANEDRNAFPQIGHDMIEAEYLDVIMGAGHPGYDDDGEARTPNYGKFAQADFEALSAGNTGWDYIESKTDFEALARGEITSEKLFGLAQVASTLQQNRSGDSAGTLPGEVAFNDNVPDLPTMSEGALNVLGQNDKGFHLMIESGAIDWTGHANQTTRNIEETQDFNAAVDTVIDWVEENSSWDDTLLVVTADHETGYLGGAEDDPDFTQMYGNAGELPTVSWSSPNHTNLLVPFFFKGAGSEALQNAVVGTDSVRGDYIDNTTLATLLKGDLWADETTPVEPGEGDIPVEVEIPGLPGDDDDNAPGSLVLSIADGTATLGNQRNAGDRLRVTGELPAVSVTDTRRTGAGWAVAGQSSDLSIAGDSGESVTADHLGWAPFVTDTTNSATPGEVSRGVLADGEGLAAPATLGSATDQTRLGTSDLAADLVLEVPVDTEAGTYTGALSVSLFPVD